MQSKQQHQQLFGVPPIVSSNSQTIQDACQWLATSSAATRNHQLDANRSNVMQVELDDIELVRHEDAHRPGSRTSSKSSRSRSCSRSTQSEREADLNDLVDCFREQTKNANNHQAAPQQTTTADAQKLVSALQNQLESAFAVAAAATAAAAAVSTASSLVAPYQYPLTGDRFHIQQRQQHHVMTPTTKIEQPTMRHDFAPLDLKILQDYDWQDLSRFSATSSRSSRSRSASPRNRSSPQHGDFNLVNVEELDPTTGCVQRTEIVQTLSSELEPDANNNFAQDSSRIDCAAQNLVTTNTTPRVSTTNSSTSLLASVSKQTKAKQSANTSTKNNGTTTTSTLRGVSNQNGQSNQSDDPAQRQKRMFKCRHCPFETDQKVENWRHIRIHMRPERILPCNSCEFVTEYKHHLEYHQRNHTGYKPFKCPHCDYTCVNNSMLNSHMKSHSTVYQYQCGDCKYATKYVHSLKMHLRKYQHQPAEYMIDIYARKRGPKPGSGRKQQLLKQQELERQIREQVEQQRALQALQGTSAPPSRRGGGSKKSRQSQAQQKQQQQEQQQQCILDLRVESKLSK